MRVQFLMSASQTAPEVTIMSLPNIDQIIAFESGELDEDETIELFQELVTSGVVWSLQGFYGRTAQELINAGLVVER